jgi:hypothetical protein
MDKDIKELEQLYASLGLDPDTVEGDYKESVQKHRKIFEDGFKKFCENVDQKKYLDY